MRIRTYHGDEEIHKPPAKSSSSSSPQDAGSIPSAPFQHLKNKFKPTQMSPDTQTKAAARSAPQSVAGNSSAPQPLGTKMPIITEPTMEANDAIAEAERLVAKLNKRERAEKPKINLRAKTSPQAIAIARAMIERLSTVEDTEKIQAEEFLYHAKNLVKFMLNPMRGLASTKIGKSKAPIAVYLDYSGSCDHIANLFGELFVGFANEGAMILIGGNGIVTAVYKPFENMHHALYEHDALLIREQLRMRDVGNVNKSLKVCAGVLIAHKTTELTTVVAEKIIACTDGHSTASLLARKPFDTHVIFALEHDDFLTIRREGGLQTTSWHEGSETLALAKHQHVHLVHDRETLMEAIRLVR
jgi:hypothetical protein